MGAHAEPTPGSWWLTVLAAGAGTWRFATPAAQPQARMRETYLDTGLHTWGQAAASSTLTAMSNRLQGCAAAGAALLIS